MQWLTLVPEDRGVNVDRQPTGIRRVEPVAATVPVSAPAVREPTRKPARFRKPGTECREGDRRGGERRGEQQPVVLDTRCGDRRRGGDRRRRAPDAERQPVTGTRINLYA